MSTPSGSGFDRPYLAGETLDDLMRIAYEALLSRGERITPTKGSASELTGVLLEVANPRARLSRSEMRGRPFSCLGEFCWYLAGSDRLDFIQYYIQDYQQFADGDTVYGAYGPRLRNWRGTTQLCKVVDTLRQRPDSRQAVIQLFDATDVLEPHSDVPCTCSLQFLLRGGNLHLVASMRSNDAYLGLPHDVFSFTMIQEIVARSVGADVGSYKHAVGSLHIYDTDRQRARRYLSEGWQTRLAMPPMPIGDPYASIDLLLEMESSLRLDGVWSARSLANLDPFWGDLARMLYVFQLWKAHDREGIERLRGDMSSNVYDLFIQQRIAALDV
jgi:thymidylate synthase